MTVPVWDSNAPTPVLVDGLVDVLGSKMVAVIGGARDVGVVDTWAAGIPPAPKAEMAVRLAFEAVGRMIDRMGLDTIRGWFAGTNEFLHASPAVVIRERAEDESAWTDVLNAASAFLAES